MRWSKVRKLVEESFAPSVRGRVSIHSTNSKQKGIAFACNCGWGWIALDGRVIAALDTHDAYKIYRTPIWEDHPPILPSDRGRGLVERGEFSRDDLHEACWRYLHSSINDSLNSTHPLLQSLAVLSARVGKNRLRRVASRELHPLTGALLEFRLEAEASYAHQPEAVTPAAR